jgi:hypothetical protein
LVTALLGKVAGTAAAKINSMRIGHHPTAGAPRGTALVRAMTAVVFVMAMMLAIAGCGPSLPTEQELRATLVEQARKDDLDYNQRMDRWGAPKPEIDGSSFSMTRSHRALTSPADIKISKTKGHTTIFEAEVPRVIETTIKTGLTEQECLEAPERQLEPQRITTKYEWDNVRKTWHEVKFGGVGGLLGM